uniref:Dynein heavy chain AAA module D4 domain-containing protein n=1 Tax=Eptatretus burgeri TaxID=7764 RepID=A0A8C4R4W1_EPTBU
MDRDEFLIRNISFNYFSSSASLQVTLQKPLEKKVGRAYGPPGTKHLVYFIDDFNMPKVDDYGTVQPHTLLRQHLDYRHWYDRDTLVVRDIHNVQYVACMNHVAGSFTINPRLQGLLFSKAENFLHKTDILRLFLHESNRVYKDRMVEERDLEMFDRIQATSVKKHFHDITETELQEWKDDIFCHFSMGIDEARYLLAPSRKALHQILREVLEGYNAVHATMDLVLFEDAIAHVCRISRILKSPGGHALLVGVGGSGKQSLTRLAAFLSSMEVFQPTLHQGYSTSDLKADVANLLMKTGLKGQRTVFLLTDDQLPDLHFLVLINDLLISGEIPDVLSDDAIEEIIKGVRNQVKAAGLQDSRENCWAFFTNHVRQNLKVVLCLSPAGGKLRAQSQRYPAITSYTTIDWFHDWPPEALEYVSLRFLQETDGIGEEARSSASKFMALVHTSVNKASQKYLASDRRHYYTTPKSFLEQIKLYQFLLTKRTSELTNKIKRLENGLQKLQSTTVQVRQ